jgi:hypothetical protein
MFCHHIMCIYEIKIVTLKSIAAKKLNEIKNVRLVRANTEMSFKSLPIKFI